MAHAEEQRRGSRIRPPAPGDTGASNQQRDRRQLALDRAAPQSASIRTLLSEPIHADVPQQHRRLAMRGLATG
jgi:hypothetical protein